MGCDIHLYVETFDRAAGSWNLETEPNPYYDPPEVVAQKIVEYRREKALKDGLDPMAIGSVSTVVTADDRDDWGQEKPVQAVRSYHGRNYGLFAILANVRNGVGFAGTDLGDATKPIAEPRGVPSDASQAYQDEVEQWGVDGHSHSHFTLGELYEHDWETKVVNRSQIRRKRVFDDAARAWVPVPMSQHMRSQGLDDPDTFAKRIEQLFNQFGREAWSFHDWDFESCGWSSEGAAGGWRGIQWTTTHRDQAGDEFMCLLFTLAARAYVDGLTPDEIRIVFFFDN